MSNCMLQSMICTQQHRGDGTVAMTCMLLQTVALLNLAGPDGAKAGLALGSATSAGLIIFYLKRAIDTGGYSLAV